jgi:hypothetical protein
MGRLSVEVRLTNLANGHTFLMFLVGKGGQNVKFNLVRMYAVQTSRRLELECRVSIVRLPRVTKFYRPKGRRNQGRPLNRLLDV